MPADSYRYGCNQTIRRIERTPNRWHTDAVGLEFCSANRKRQEENKNDVLASFEPQNIVDNWQAIRDIVSAIPPAEELAALFKDLGGKYRLPDIGIDEALEPEILDISAAIRNRLTLARMRRVLDFEE